MLGVATWTKLALALFTLGGAAGGTYYFRGNLVGRDNSDPSTSLGGNDDSLSNKDDSGKNSDDRDSENKLDSSTGKEISDTVSKNSDSGNEGVENSPTSPEQSSVEGMSGDETNQKPEDSSSVTSTSENVGVQATNLQESPETNRDAEVITSEDGGTHEQSTISDSSGVQKDLQVGTEKTEPDSQKQEPLPLTSVISSTPSPANHSQSGEFSSGRRDSNYQFGGNVNGELIFPKINSEGESICVVASEGIGKELEDLEKCKNMVSQYLKNVEQGQEKIWMKVKEKNHVKKIFETLDPSNNNISLENDFEVNLLYDKFSCKFNSHVENSEIVVSCFKKLNSE